MFSVMENSSGINSVGDVGVTVASSDGTLLLSNSFLNAANAINSSWCVVIRSGAFLTMFRL